MQFAELARRAYKDQQVRIAAASTAASETLEEPPDVLGRIAWITPIDRSLCFSADAVGSDCWWAHPTQRDAAGGTINYHLTTRPTRRPPTAGTSPRTPRRGLLVGTRIDEPSSGVLVEGDGSYFWRDININSWPNNKLH